MPEAVLRAAQWRAARFGISGTLWSPAQATLVLASVALDDFAAELRPDLERHGEYALLLELLVELRARGTSATRQRHTLASTGSLHEVVVPRCNSRRAGAAPLHDAGPEPAPS